MFLSIRRAPQEEIDAIPADEGSGYIFGLEHHAPKSEDTVIPIFDEWIAAHIAISGKGWNETLPESFVLAGEYWHQEHPEMEPSRILSAEKVKEVASYLSGLNDDLMEKRLIELGLEPFDMPTRFSPEDAQYIISWVKVLIEFVKTAADQNEAIVKSISA